MFTTFLIASFPIFFFLLRKKEYAKLRFSAIKACSHALCGYDYWNVDRISLFKTFLYIFIVINSVDNTLIINIFLLSLVPQSLFINLKMVLFISLKQTFIFLADFFFYKKNSYLHVDCGNLLLFYVHFFQTLKCRSINNLYCNCTIWWN